MDNVGVEQYTFHICKWTRMGIMRTEILDWFSIGGMGKDD